MRVLNPVEEAYLSGTRDFTKAQQRYIRYRLKKKLMLLDESRDAAAAQLLRRLDNDYEGRRKKEEPTCPCGQGSSNNIIVSNTETKVRGSPSLVGRGIANPMSERTRGFEMMPSQREEEEEEGGTSVPLPAPFSFISHALRLGCNGIAAKLHQLFLISS